MYQLKPLQKKETLNKAFEKSRIQTKLKIGQTSDKYEQEADSVADRVMRMSDNDSMQMQPVEEEDEVMQPKLRMQPLEEEEVQIQMKCANCEEEEMLQTKSGSGEQFASPFVLRQIQMSNGNGKSLPSDTNKFMSNAFGNDFSSVQIHNDSNAFQMNQKLGARAFTIGSDIYFNEGQYNPNSGRGKHLLAHELTHTVQQGAALQPKGKSNLIQRYLEANGTAGAAIGNSYRISDDLTTAVKVGYPNHDLYAEAGKAAASNAMLAKVGSGIELIEESTTFGVSQGSNKKTLKKVIPKNVQNLTSGNNMKISDDCGTSCAVVVGGNRRNALHFDAMTKTNAKTSATTPALMKAEIMKKLLNKWLLNPSTSAAVKTEINDTIAKADAKQLEINIAIADYNTAATEADKKIKSDIYWAKVEEYGNIMMSFYNKMSESKREEIDKYLEINKYVNPDVGQGYTMSSGGTNYPGESTWNFHWGGVVMKSNDQKDTVTLENYAVAGDVENENWDFAMYGTAAKKGQTFHEQHHDTKQHGDRPTTMTIEKT